MSNFSKYTWFFSYYFCVTSHPKVYGCHCQRCVPSSAVSCSAEWLVLLLHRPPEHMCGAWLCQARLEDSTPVHVWNSRALAELCTHLGSWHFVVCDGMPRMIRAVLRWLVVWSEKSQAVIPAILVGQSGHKDSQIQGWGWGQHSWWGGVFTL